MKMSKGYTSLQIALHWVIALGVVFNYIVSEGMGKALDERLGGQDVSIAIAAFHVWVGVALLVLVVIRIAVRLTSGAPAPEAGMLGLFARVAHGALYLLILVVPLFGGLAWFAGVEAVADAHALLANVLVIVAGLHALAGLYHGLILKDGILRRMMRPV